MAAALFVLLVVAIGGCIVALVLVRRSIETIAELERTRSEVRRAFTRLGDALGASDDREVLVGVVLEAALAVTGADTAVFWVDRGPSIDARAGRGLGGDDSRRVEQGRGVVGAVASTGKPVLWPPGTDRPVDGEPPATTSLAVPVQARGRLFGVLSLYRQGGPVLTSAQLDEMVVLARQMGAAIDTSYLHEEARRQSLTDGLTGLWNRRQFELRAGQELERASRFGERFSVVLIDLDDFKSVNDTHGHLAGDAVLVETARRLVGQTREVDTVARYGGEEFVLLLPMTDVAGAARVAEKVRAELAARPVATDGGPVTITLSAGVAGHPEDGDSIPALLGAADKSLYQAKAAGKNRVVHADPDQHGAASE